MWASSPGLASKHLLLRICRRIPRCIALLLARFAPQLQEINPRFADLRKRKTTIPADTGFILPAVADGSRFHALCRKIAFLRRFQQEFGRSQGRTGGNEARKRQVLCRFGPLRLSRAPTHPTMASSPIPPPHSSPSGSTRGPLAACAGLRKGPRVRPEGDATVLEAIVACTNYTPRVLEGKEELTLSILSPPHPLHATIPPSPRQSAVMTSGWAG